MNQNGNLSLKPKSRAYIHLSGGLSLNVTTFLKFQITGTNKTLKPINKDMYKLII